MRKVQPTFVLFSPYAFQNNKKIEFAAKHGSLFFAIISALCMILIRFYTSGNFWILFLPQFVFYSIVYVFARNCNNKTFQFTQILITYLLVFYNEYLFIFANLNFEFNYCAALFELIISIATLINPLVLHIVYRKHFVEVSEENESIITLNVVDFCQYLLFYCCFGVSIPVTKQLTILFPLYIDQTPKQTFVTSSLSELEVFILAGVFVCLTFMIVLYLIVTHWNRSKSMAKLSDVMFDSNGRAWYSMSDQFIVPFSASKKWCLTLIKHRFFSSNKHIGQTQLTVPPEESQKLHLKHLTVVLA